MSMNDIVSVIFVYAFQMIFTIPSVAVFSYAYYVKKFRSTGKTRQAFQESLREPVKYLFAGNKNMVEYVLIGSSKLRHSKSPSLDEYFEVTPLSTIQVQRYKSFVLNLALPGLAIVLALGNNELSIELPALVYLVVFVLTLIACMRFGRNVGKFADSRAIDPKLEAGG